MVPSKIQTRAKRLYTGTVNFQGPYLRPDGRKFIVLIYASGKRSTTLLSRFKMTLHLDRVLSAEEDVDHKDEDRTNDRVSNLQLLSKSKNSSKHMVSRYGRQQKKQCIVCGDTFRVPPSKRDRKFCSNSCRSNHYGANQYGNRLTGYCGRGEVG